VLALAPFLAADHAGVLHALRYRGAPGLGGISLLVQPALATNWLTNAPGWHLTSISRAVNDYGGVLTAAALLAAGVLLMRHRVSAFPAAVIVWLTVYAFSANFFIQYLVWGLPFFLMAGHLRWGALLEAVMFVPTVLAYWVPWNEDFVGPLYATLLILVWAGWIASLFVCSRHAARHRHPRLATPAPG
jgi:hypothetical protein